MRLRALIFDLDDTLVDSRAAYRRALAAAGIDPQGAEFAAARDAVKARLPRGHVCARSRVLYFKALCEARGERSPRALLQLTRRYERALQADLRLQWRALGRAALFGRLARRFRLALCTNETARTQLLKLEALDPQGKLFETMVTSEEVGHEKPHPKMFETVLARLALPAAGCLFVGNDLEADVRAARRRGLRALWTREFEPGARAAAEAAGSLDRLADLEGLLP